jgi:hypothetical protein
VAEHRSESDRSQNLEDPEGLEYIATFRGECDCGCPEVFLDRDASDERLLVI